MKRSLAALAVIPLLAACSSKPTEPKNRLIVLDRSIGGVSLLERRAQVERNLGKGVLKAPNSPNRYIAYAGGKLAVWYARGRVLAVKTRSPQFRTFTGVGVGSGARELHTIRELKCYGGSDCQHGFRVLNQRGTGFHLGPDGTVVWVGIAFGH